ncbi:MAG TPA: uroporphyrinogen decarboxylase family protein [Anaerolineaceae bacterium]|nr:uroporphyrinogen decarboxylase family protein [Anaerolineaceae bacterium]HPN53600.1 uroporphyrinogen decarboxylase family protein [Anaerolineaceae bacterium]
MIDTSPLPRAEVIKAIERKNPRRVPMIRARSWGEGFEELHGDRLEYFKKYPEDAVFLFLVPIQYEKMGLSWALPDTGAHDSRAVVDDWSKLDEFIARLPDPEKDPQFDQLAEEAELAHREDRYILFSFWRYFFERPWQIRGMENLLTDYYNHPEQVHQLHEALYHLYEGYIRRAKRDLQPDGFWTSDDLGHQTNLFMRPATFRNFIKPYYARTGALLRELEMHWWLHSCGNNTAIMPDLAEVGVNVFHPVQKGTMDEVKIVEVMGGKLSFLVGFDVQHILQEATPEGVREEVRHLIDTFDLPEGGMCLGAGNGILPGTPLENIEAFMEETLIYGTAHRKSYQQ